MKKVLFVATVVKTHINVFHIPYLKMLKEMGYETHVAARNDFEDPKECIIPYCDYYHDIPFERSPIKKNNIFSYKQLKQIMLEENYDIVHCHTPVGGAITRLVYKNIKSRVKTKCIYTAHGFHFFKGAPLKNWIIFYPIEKYLSKYTDVLITINKEDYQRAKEKFKMKKLEYIPGVGVDENKFKLKNFNRDEYRKNLGVSNNDFMILSVGELIPRKNHKLVIDALSLINNHKIQYFIVGSGELYNELDEYIKKLGLQHNIHLLGFRKDVAKLNKASDLFIFPSKQEGLPVAVMEAIISDTICAVSNIRGNVDLIENNINGFLFDFKDVLYIKNIIEKIYSLSSKDKFKIIKNNNKIKSIVLFTNIKQKYKKIYESIII
ncbi:MAG: glycosyltransferase family 4 protein [Thomasclavelia sp.]